MEDKKKKASGWETLAAFVFVLVGFFIMVYLTGLFFGAGLSDGWSR